MLLVQLSQWIRIFFHQSTYCEISYFRWDFISRFCHIVYLEHSKIRIYGRVAIENPLNIFIFTGFIITIITPSRK
jgi:hypothetical protein